MKKYVMGTIMVAGLLLLASCGPQEGIGPVRIDNSGVTPTPIVVPTCTPTVTPTPDPSTNPPVTEPAAPTELPKATATPTMEPTVVPTEAVFPSATPTEAVEPTAEPTATTAPTKTPEPTTVPTATPAVNPTPEPTEVPQETVTPTQVPQETAAPTEVPQETVTPIPEITQMPEPTVTPIVDPKPLVYRGWQQTVSIDDEYLIIFPDMFLDSVVSKSENELRIDYSCAADPAIGFSVTYMLNTTLTESLEGIGQEENAELDSYPEENRVDFSYQKDGNLYDGLVLQSRYAGALLGGQTDNEWIDGIMKVVFTYPAEHKNFYETVTYRYFVISSREE